MSERFFFVNYIKFSFIAALKNDEEREKGKIVEKKFLWLFLLPAFEIIFFASPLENARGDCM